MAGLAKQRQWVDSVGNTYPASFWQIHRIDINLTESTVSCWWRGYRDKQAYVDKRDPIPGAVHEFRISGADFLAFMGQELYKQKNIAELAHHAASTIPTVTAPGEEEPTLLFFADAVDVVGG